jgi:hypothetical protein
MGANNRTLAILGGVVLGVIVFAGYGLKAMLTRPKTPQEAMEEYARQAQAQMTQAQKQMAQAQAQAQAQMAQAQAQMLGAGANGTPSNNGTPSKQEAAITPLPPPAFTIQGDAMAQAFRSSKLPSPLPQPTGAPEQTAAELAKRVIAEDEQSTAALLTAVQMSGFSVRADDGSLAYESVKPGQGIVIDAWEVAALSKLFGEGGMPIKLSDLSNAFASTFPPLKNAPVAKLFVDGIRGAAQGNQPAMRFWADFIAELGRQSPQHYDLLAPSVDAGKVDLDVIQVSLILRRLAVDIMIQERSKNQKGELAPVPMLDSTSARWEHASYQLEDETPPHVLDAVWHPERGPRLVFVQEGGGSSRPCTISELGNQIMDSSAYISGKVFDAVLEYLEHAGVEGAGKYGAATSKANAVLALIKLLVYYACLETEITISGNPPLERTKSVSVNGERRTLTGTVRENTKNWQAVNCTRIALNGANLDISLPNDGPVEGVHTQWMLKSGGLSVSGNKITYPIVEFVFGRDTPLIQTAMVPITNPASPKTNEEGKTTIDLEGVKQKEQLRSPVAVMKQAEVNFSVAPKAVTMRQDVIDALGNGVGIPIKEGKKGFPIGGRAPTASPLTILVGGLVETALRSNLHLSKTLTIPVKDWVSCDGGWGGTISYTTTTQTTTTGGDYAGPWTNTREETTVNQITLRGEPNATGWSGSSHGSFSASYDLEDTTVIVNPPVKLFRGAVHTIQDKQIASGSGETTADIHAREDGRYDIQIKGANFPGNEHWQARCTGDCGKSSAPTEKDSPMVASILGMTVTTGKVDPDHQGVLSGGAALENTPVQGATTKITWNLDQCQGGK